MGPALGTAPARGPWGFRHHRTSRRQSPTSAHARCRAGNGEERGWTQHARNPATLPLKSPQQAAWRSPRLSQGPMVASPPRKSHSESFVGQTRGQALCTAPARGPWGFRHHGTSRRQLPTSAHARCRAGNGEERGRTQHTRNPATLPLKSPQQAASRSPRLGQGPMVCYSRERLLPSRFQERYAACPGPLPGSRWPPGARPARRSRTGTARVRMGGEEESARMGDSNPGCNYLVKGYSPSMHFF